MLPQEMNTICKDAFIELVGNTGIYKEKTFCYFHPFKGKSSEYHITIVEKSTGFGIVIPLSAKAAMLLEKDNMKDIYYKALKGLMVAVDKKAELATPVDYQKQPLKAGGRVSKLERIEKSQNVTVEIFNWSTLLIV